MSSSTKSNTPLTVAYYCSGHGYGHATRVSAFVVHLLSLLHPPEIRIVSSAPKHIFSNITALGASYRYAEIDPVIFQPVAYHVDRSKSFEVMRDFISRKDLKIKQEVNWLKKNNIGCVFSDAAFLPCVAAKISLIPSVLITNFTFDAVYSYLCSPKHSSEKHLLNSDYDNYSEQHTSTHCSGSHKDAEDLIKEIYNGYLCADRLILLPGHIPIPSFHCDPPLPAYTWVNDLERSFTTAVMKSTSMRPSYTPFSVFPSPISIDGHPAALPREIVYAPLIVRPCFSDATLEIRREEILKSIGVPNAIYGKTIKMLVVSFGGQVIHKPPSNSNSNAGSGAVTPLSESDMTDGPDSSTSKTDIDSAQISDCNNIQQSHLSPTSICKLSHICVRGAPPRSLSSLSSTPTDSRLNISAVPASPLTDARSFIEKENTMTEPAMLPDSTWIAIVCGVPSGWGQDNGEELPEGFYIAPQDVYMPDLTAVADVVMGKLGYGTVSECINACTPFVYVPRPLFIEEYGLRLLLEREGVGIELPEDKYEAGDWSQSIYDAWLAGRAFREERKNNSIRNDRNYRARTEEGRKLAQDLVYWVEMWKASNCAI